jgi:SAM-dependent methyltransferase
MVEYADVANQYDRHYQRPIDLAENLLLRRLLTSMVNGKVVYDLGCGTGLLLDVGLTPTVYVGIDLSSPMIDVLRRKHRHVLGIVGHAEAPTTWWAAHKRAGSPEVVTALFAANYFDLLATATLAYGFLSSGGSLFLHGGGPRYQRRRSFILTKNEPSFKTWTPRKIRKALRTAGFTDIRFKTVNGLPDWLASRIPDRLIMNAARLAAAILPLRLQYHFAVYARRP